VHHQYLSVRHHMRRHTLHPRNSSRGLPAVEFALAAGSSQNSSRGLTAIKFALACDGHDAGGAGLRLHGRQQQLHKVEVPDEVHTCGVHTSR